MICVAGYQKTQKATQERDSRKRRHRQRRVSNRVFHDAMLAASTPLPPENACSLVMLRR